MATEAELAQVTTAMESWHVARKEIPFIQIAIAASRSAMLMMAVCCVPCIRTCEDVGKWLQSIGLGDYTKQFADNQIDGRALAHLDKQGQRDIGVTIVGHQPVSDAPLFTPWTGRSFPRIALRFMTESR